MSNESQLKEKAQPKNLTDVLTEKRGTLNVDDTVQAAGDKMRAMEANALPVSEGRRLVGTVLEPHPDRSAAGHGHDPLTERVGVCMSRELIFCYEDQDRSDAERLMKERGLTYLPIVDHDMRIVGIVTSKDLTACAEGNNDPS